ncbi:MAG TPA: hypothetical protein VFT74_15150 [Isosphaeraceae bacterium]|nr:hypothetical protein [Isosphaeraceae bacterium]
MKFLPVAVLMLLILPSASLDAAWEWTSASAESQGLNPDGAPLWTNDLADRRPIFRNPDRCGRSSVRYNAGLRRYLWCQTFPGGDARFRGGFAILDAPEPWGPWTTSFFTEEWDAGPGESCSLPTKWMSPDGKTIHLVFSGDDHFSVRKAELILSEPTGTK